MSESSRFEISVQTHSANFSMYNFHSHSWYEIFWLKKGKCNFFMDDKAYLMNAGDIAVIPPDLKHKTAYIDETNERLCIEFTEDFIQPLFASLGKQTVSDNLFTVLHPQFENTAVMDSLIKNMAIEKQTDDYLCKSFLSVYFQEFLLRLMRTHIPAEGQTVESFNSNNTIQLAVAYIDNNFQSKITLHDIADKFHLNASYFSKRFKTVHGIGFKEYLNNLRITHSEKLLLETKRCITEIAFECGFENSNYFGDAFRSKNGISPTEYRKVKGNIRW